MPVVPSVALNPTTIMIAGRIEGCVRGDPLSGHGMPTHRI
jgi:hypothetical protein